MKEFVTYSDFGAVGDGVANDFEAMLNAHAYANENKLPVKGESGKSYRIVSTEKDGLARTIIIKTPTDWQGTTIIVDDTDIAHADGKGRDFNSPIFRVEPYEEIVEISEETIASLPKITTKTTKIDLGLGYPALAVLYNDEVRHYIRYGPNANQGSPQHELVVLDKDGNVDPTTPLMYDYAKITKIEAIKIDIDDLVLENATFLQRASHIDTVKILPDGTVKNKNKSYFHRNMEISRSNTFIRNCTHLITGEVTVDEQAAGMYGPAYKGFFCPSFANNVTIEDCTLTARRYYTPGTYGFSAGLTNNIVLKNCKQTNFYKKDENGNDTNVLSMETNPKTGKLEYWGLGGTSFCKNMVYDGCEITRYDAHQGLCNGKIINCHIAMINLIGAGEMLIENSYIELKESSIVNLRMDYGSTWNGNITIRNCTVDHNEAVKKKEQVWLFNFNWVNHFFGYTCHFPNLEVDNLKLVKSHLAPIHIFPTHNGHSPAVEKNLHLPSLMDGSENLNPIVPPAYLRVVNNEQGVTYDVADVPFVDGTEIVGIEKASVE